MSGWNEALWYSLFVGTALKSVAVLGAARLTSILLRGRSAAARHLLWTAASAALLALPFLSASLPAVRVPVGRTLLPPSAAFQTIAPAAPDGLAPQAHAQASAPAAVKSRLWRPDWRLCLMLLWAAGAAVLLAQMLAGWAAIRRVRRTADRFTDSEAAALREALGIQGEVDVLETRRGSMPMTFGLLRPAVFIPADAAEWSQDRRRMVLLHELAHVRRRDVAKHLLARTALSLYWWNPLAWTAWREFLKERERAADDLVLRAGARASEYAAHLLGIARAMQSPPAAAWAAVAMARHSQLEGRLLAILDRGVNRNNPGRTSAWAVALLAAVVVAPLAALRAQDNPAQALPADVESTIRTATAQKNYDLLDRAAKAAETLRKYEAAEKLLESSLAIRAEVSGQQSVDYGLGLLNLGQLERKRDRFGEAEAFYAKAVSVLGDRPEAAPALLGLGIAALVKKDVEQARDYFQRSQLVDPANAGPAMMWMAVVEQRQNNLEEAESLYRGTLAAQDPNSPDAATAMELYGQLLRQQGREDEANSLQDQAAAVRKALGAQAASAGAAASPNVYRAGNGVTAPTLLHKVEPVYTEEARAARYQGKVVLSTEIGTDGLARNTKVVQGLGLGLDDKAVEAISQWSFSPGMKDGQPVTVAATIEVNWRLL